MATGLLVDADIEGHFQAVLAVCQGPVWREFWAELRVSVQYLRDVGLPHNAPDSEVWELCQQRQLVLVTGNRNLESESSLEATIRSRGTAESLPVLTLADREHILRDHDYAERVAARMIERLGEIDSLRGSGRLYLP